jgi:hypothetical protein
MDNAVLIREITELPAATKVVEVRGQPMPVGYVNRIPRRNLPRIQKIGKGRARHVKPLKFRNDGSINPMWLSYHIACGHWLIEHNKGCAPVVIDRA